MCSVLRHPHETTTTGLSKIFNKNIVFKILILFTEVNKNNLSLSATTQFCLTKTTDETTSHGLITKSPSKSIANTNEDKFNSVCSINRNNLEQAEML